MLTKLYRHGPARQRVWKGYIVAAGPKSLALRDELLARRDLLAGLGVRLRLDPQRRGLAAVWLDTDLVWLHTPEARTAVFARLTQATTRVRAFLNQHKGELLPGAVRLDKKDPWRWYLCGDHHFLEVGDDAEREVFCNLLREHLPVLIALTGRAGAGPEGVEPAGSRRLNDSTRHFTPRFLASASPGYLDKLARGLQRDAGIAQLNALDINPAFPLDDIRMVETRFTDSVALVASVRAQALLFEALFIRARRLVRAGMRPFPSSQNWLERNRTLAIAEGVDARFQAEYRDQRRRPPRPRPALELWLQLLKRLRYEFAVLEATFDELAPLLLGPELRLLGHGSLVNENDVFRLLHRQHGNQLPRQAAELTSATTDLLSGANQKLFASASNFVRSAWQDMLKSYDKELPADKRDEWEAFFGPWLPKEAWQKHERVMQEEARAAQARRDAEEREARAKRDAEAREAREAAKSQLKPAKPRYEKPDPHRLHAEIVPLPEEPRRLAVMLGFLRVTNCRDLGVVFKQLDKVQCEELRKAIRPPNDRQFRLTPGDKLWDDPGANDAVESAKKHGSAMLSIRVPSNEGNAAEQRVFRMSDKLPEGIEAFLFYRGFAGKQGGIEMVCFDQLLISQSVEASS